MISGPEKEGKMSAASWGCILEPDRASGQDPSYNGNHTTGNVNYGCTQIAKGDRLCEFPSQCMEMFLMGLSRVYKECTWDTEKVKNATT